MKYYGGIDLGGTKVYSIIIDEKGNILSRSKKKIAHLDNFDEILDTIVSCYNESLEASQIESDKIEAVGMAVPSSVDIQKGILKHAPNLGWKDIEIAKLMHEKLNKPVFIDNDVNMGTFGEYHFTNAKNYKHIYGIFMGTGVGGAYMIDGNIIRGKNYTAGEIGHMIVSIDGPHCNCGNKGCLEAIAGKVGMIEYLKRKVEKGEFTLLDEISPNWRTSVGSSALKKAYLKNDKLVKKAIKKTAKAIGIACANLVNTIGVEAIILGGGVVEEMGSLFIERIQKHLHKNAIADGDNGVELIQSVLGDDAVALGAAWFVSLPEKSDLLYTK